MYVRRSRWVAAAGAFVLVSVGVFAGPANAAAASGCDDRHVYGYLHGPLEQQPETPGGAIVSFDLRNGLVQDGIVFRKQWPDGGALGINPTSSTYWFTTQGNRVWSAKPGGSPYNWRELSGPADKDGFAFSKDGKGHFLVNDTAGPSVYVFPAGRPADRRRVPLSGTGLADDPPTDLAFSGVGEAWLITAAGRLWHVRDTAATTAWTATLFGAIPPNEDLRIDGLAFGVVDGTGALIVSGDLADSRFVGRLHAAEGGGLHVIRHTVVRGAGGVADLASCLFPDKWE